MKPVPSYFAPFKTLPICLGLFASLLLAGCGDQRKAEVDDRKDATVDSIEAQRDAVDRDAKHAKEIAEANAEADKARIEAEAEATEAQLDADRVRAESEADAAKAEIDAERARVDADRARADTRDDDERVRRDTGITPDATNAPFNQQNQDNR